MAKRTTKKTRAPRQTNKFRAPGQIDHAFENPQGELIGTLRVVPSGVKWKIGGKHRFHTVSLKKFADWITDPSTNASVTKK